MRLLVVIFSSSRLLRDVEGEPNDQSERYRQPEPPADAGAPIFDGDRDGAGCAPT